MDASTMAGGGGQMPQQQQGQQPQIQTTPGQTQTNDPQKIIQALEAAIQQAVNPQGYVDLNKLVLLWPQISQKMGINVPFQTVMQMIQQNPELIDNIVNQLGLAGIIVNGKVMSAQQLLGQSGAGQAGGGMG